MSLSPTNLTFSPMAIEVDCADFPVITALQQAQWRVNHPAFRTRCVLLACRASRVSLPPAQQPTNHATSPTARAFQTAQCPIRAVRCALRTVPADSEHDCVRSVPCRKHVRHRVLLRLPAHAQVHVPAGPVPCVRGPGATRGIQNAAARGTHRGTWRGVARGIRLGTWRTTEHSSGRTICVVRRATGSDRQRRSGRCTARR